MKFIVCLALLAACAEALPRSRNVRSTEDCDGPAEQIVLASEQLLADGLVSPRNGQFNNFVYAKNACHEWNIITVDNECIVITLGTRGGFVIENGYDFLFFKDSNSVSETVRTGFLFGLLFASETNSVNVRFTSDHILEMRGFRLDVRSTSCDWVQQVELTAGGVTEGAIVTDTECDGLYPDRAVESWRLTTVENQCINITVGQDGFDTELYYDYVIFDNDQETRRSGKRPTGNVLFTSEANSLEVSFLSNNDTRSSGFSLDVISIDCADGN